jgi:hypothetical protein
MAKPVTRPNPGQLKGDGDELFGIHCGRCCVLIPTVYDVAENFPSARSCMINATFAGFGTSKGVICDATEYGREHLQSMASAINQPLTISTANPSLDLAFKMNRRSGESCDRMRSDGS